MQDKLAHAPSRRPRFPTNCVAATIVAASIAVGTIAGAITMHAVYLLALLVAGGRCDVVDGKRRSRPLSVSQRLAAGGVEGRDQLVVDAEGPHPGRVGEHGLDGGFAGLGHGITSVEDRTCAALVS